VYYTLARKTYGESSLPQKGRLTSIVVVAFTPLINVAILLLTSRSLPDYNYLTILRYHTWYFPSFCVASAFGAYFLLKVFRPIQYKAVASVIIITMFLFFFQSDVLKISENPGSNNINDEKKASWIANRKDIDSDSVQVVWAIDYTDGLISWYFDKRGCKPPKRGIMNYYEAIELSNENIRKIYWIDSLRTITSEVKEKYLADGYRLMEIKEIDETPCIYIFVKSVK
jgi:hypothetical protein